jgi:transposase
MNTITNFLNLQDITIDNFSENETTITINAHIPHSPQVCPHCGSVHNRIHGSRIQKIKDLPTRLKDVLIYLNKRRYKCMDCGKTFFEKCSFLPKYHRFTNRVYIGICNAFKSANSLKSIANAFNTSINTVQRMFKLVTIPHKKLLPTALGIDEFKGNTNREKYQCILTNLDTGEIFDILPTRKKSDLAAYFRKFPNRNDVKYYVMDMTNNYKSLEYLFPNAKIIVDRFHYIRQVYWALDAVRKDVQKSFVKGKRIYFKHSKKLLFKDFKDLSDEDKQALIVMLSQSEKLHTAWRLKEDFKYFREAATQEEAERELHIWIMEAQESGLIEFKAATKALNNWFRYIINSVVYKYSNGMTEGFNNKIKVLKRNAYGFHDFDNFKKRILLNCEKHGKQAEA